MYQPGAGQRRRRDYCRPWAGGGGEADRRTEVPTLALSHLTHAERRAYVIADHKLALNAGWDSEILAIELQGLIDLEFDVSLTGFSLAEIDLVPDDARVASAETPAGPDDAVPAVPARWVTAWRPRLARAPPAGLRRCARRGRLCRAAW